MHRDQFQNLRPGARVVHASLPDAVGYITKTVSLPNGRVSHAVEWHEEGEKTKAGILVEAITLDRGEVKVDPWAGDEVWVGGTHWGFVTSVEREGPGRWSKVRIKHRNRPSAKESWTPDTGFHLVFVDPLQEEVAESKTIALEEPEPEVVPPEGITRCLCDEDCGYFIYEYEEFSVAHRQVMDLTFEDPNLQKVIEFKESKERSVPEPEEEEEASGKFDAWWA